jgi:hypothetical protein
MEHLIKNNLYIPLGRTSIVLIVVIMFLFVNCVLNLCFLCKYGFLWNTKPFKQIAVGYDFYTGVIYKKAISC